MNLREETNSIWLTIKGAEHLRKIYGCYPTLHDASILKFDVNFEAKEISFKVWYSDLEDTEIKTILTIFTITWKNVLEANFRHYNNDIYRLYLSRKNDLIESLFENYSWGFQGNILAESIEVSDIQVEPNLPELSNEDINTVYFSFIS